MAKKMKRKRWAEAEIELYYGDWWLCVYVGVYVEHCGFYSHRRSARRAAIQWAKRNSYELRWV